MNKKLIGVGVIGLVGFLLFMPKTQKVTVGSGGGVGTNWGFTETMPSLGNITPTESIPLSLPAVNIYESSEVVPTSKKSSHSSSSSKSATAQKIYSELSPAGYTANAPEFRKALPIYSASLDAKYPSITDLKTKKEQQTANNKKFLSLIGR